MSALFDQDDLDQCLIFLESEAVVQNMLCQNCRDRESNFVPELFQALLYRAFVQYMCQFW